MKLGVNLAYMASADQFHEHLRTAKAAEQYGYDSVWVAEAYGSDAATPLAYIASQTERIRLGSAIFQIPGRTPANCAMVSATLDLLSGGRFILGIGSSGPQVAEGWHGQPFAKQIKRTREYVAIVRKALARERLEFDGELYKLPLPDGPGKALKLMIKPVQERIPIFLAAIGPNNTALAGEIADGWLPYLFSPEYLKNFTGSLEEGAARAGRTLDDVEISPTVFTAIGDDLDACRAMIKPILALYVGGMGSREKNFYNRVVQSYGFEKEAKRCFQKSDRVPGERKSSQPVIVKRRNSSAISAFCECRMAKICSRLAPISIFEIISKRCFQKSGRVPGERKSSRPVIVKRRNSSAISAFCECRMAKICSRMAPTSIFESISKEIQDLYLDGKQAEAIGAVPDELVDLTSLVGSAEQVGDRIAAYRDAGVDNLIVAPLAVDEASRDELLRTVAEFA